MRPLLAISVCALILGGLQLYFQLRARESFSTVELQPASGDFIIEITPAFEAGADPFSLRGAKDQAVSARIASGEQSRELFPPLPSTPLGVTVSAKVTGEFVAGVNSLHIRVLRGENVADTAAAARVCIRFQNQLLADTTLWAERGSPVEGDVVFHVPSDLDQARRHASPPPHP